MLSAECHQTVGEKNRRCRLEGHIGAGRGSFYANTHLKNTKTRSVAVRKFLRNQNEGTELDALEEQ